MIGKVLGNRYEILEKIGTGGMGNVYKAHCRRLDRIVAIKVLKLEYNEDNNFIRKFKRESLAAASISHPNIVSIYDVGSETIDGELIHYIVMEYIDGKTLKEIINEEGKLSIQRSLNYCMQIAEALKVAHSKHIVHRDIKSQNIMVTRDERVKVTDFGIARVADNTTVTATNAVMGSVHYFSPEQAKGAKVDNRSDIYSLGIVLYEMLTGTLPFDADNPVSVALMQVQSNMPSPSEKVRSIPPEVDEVVRKMTLKDPDKRYADVFELISDIKAVKSGKKVAAAPADTFNGYRGEQRHINTQRRPRPKKKKKKSAAPAILGVFSAIVIIALLAYIAPKALGSLKKTPEVEKVVVPQIVGLTKDEAEVKLKAMGLGLNITQNVNEDDKKNDEIVGQDPAADIEVEKGSSVNVIVNKLPDSEKVPSLLGKTVDAAQAELKAGTLKIGQIEHEFSDEVEEGRIIKQFPDPNTEVAKDSNIQITVSKGVDKTPITMISYKGLDAQAAKKTLQSLGFKVQLEEGKSNAVDVGQVYDQSIKAGQNAFKGDSITLYISNGTPVENVTDDENLNTPPSEENESNNSQSDSNVPTKNVSVKIPSDDKRHKVIAKRVQDSRGNKSDRIVYNWNKDPGEQVDIDLIGKGEYEIYIDGELVKNVSIK